MKIGVLALQGTFIEHIESLKKLGIETVEIRKNCDFDGINGVVIPGGESTTIIKLIDDNNLSRQIKLMASSGIPFLGTCAGMICMASHIYPNHDINSLGIMNIEVVRNAFGRQNASFEEELKISPLGDKPFPGVFIRGPVIKDYGPGIDIIARLSDGRIVAAQQNNILVTSFHPEFVDDPRVHNYFISMVADNSGIKL